MEGKVNLYEGKSYNLTSDITLIAIIILFFVLILIICLHFYARWYLQRARLRHRQRRRANLVFYVESLTPDAPSGGLDPSVIQSLPVFLYSSDTKSQSDPVECAICLSEFEENESGRVLPNCNHWFHVQCIDMWFQYHSTCPLCRSLVEPVPPGNQPGTEVVIDVCEPAGPEPGSSSECQHDGEEENRTGRTLCSSSSSIGFRRKPSFVGVTIELPLSRSFGREVDKSPTSFRSPMSRLLSFKGILSRERKTNLPPPSSDGAVGCSTIA